MSDNNVTPFPGRKRPTQEQVAAQERERAEHGAREEDKRRLKKQFEQNQPLRAADQISVAQNLYGLFVRLKKEHGLGSSKILGTRDKNKRDYAIPRDLPREEIQRLSGRLRNHTDPYKSIVELAAKAMEEVGLKVDVGDLFLEVSDKSTLGRHLATNRTTGSRSWRPACASSQTRFQRIMASQRSFGRSNTRASRPPWCT